MIVIKNLLVPNRIESLEAARGFAALVVIMWHSILGFSPAISGAFKQFPPEESLAGYPFFFIINGTGAVVFFFALSGFVLSRNFLHGTSGTLDVVKAAVKRWPRLALPTTIAALISWSFFHFDLYSYIDAAKISGSPWLSSFAFAFPAGGSGGESLDFSSALMQGLWATFFTGESYFDTSMWTMHYEFVASFFIYGSVLALIASERLSLSLKVFLLSVVSMLMVYSSTWFIPFVLGLLAAFILPRTLIKSKFLRFFFVALALYFLGYTQPRGVFAVFSGVDPIYPTSIGAVLLIASIYDLKLSDSHSKMAKFLGELSFPIYLVHVPILCSVGAFVFLWLRSAAIPFSALLAFFATILISLLVSLPIIRLNRVWVAFLNSRVSRSVESSV